MYHPPRQNRSRAATTNSSSSNRRITVFQYHFPHLSAMLYYLGQSRLSFLSPPPTPALALEGVFIATIRSCKILLLGPFSPRRRLLHRSTPSCCRTSSGKSFYPTTLLTTQPLSQASPGVTYNHRDSPKGIIPGTRVYLNLLLGPQPRFGDKLLRT